PVRPTRMAFLPLVAIAAIVTSCANSESGTPQVSDGPSSNPTSSSAVTSASADDGNGTTHLSGLDPCSFLSRSDAAQYGPVDEPQRKMVGTADTCSWEPDRSEVSGDRAGVSMAIRENAGVQDMPDRGMGVQRTSENGRDYVRSPSPTGCTIAIGVTDASRVDVLVTASDIDKACEMANTLVETVEPK